MKTCSRCKVERDESGFSKCKYSKDGLRSQCTACRAECNKVWRENNREAIAEYQKAWYENNREAVTERSKAWHEQNREVAAERNRAYREKNREAVAERMKAYREQNREAAAERNRAWREKNRGADLERKRVYRKKRLSTDATFRCRHLAAKSIHQALSRGGHTKGGRTFDHLPYTPAELSEHLLSTLQDGYTEAHFLSGELHIDHIFPHSLTPYDSLTHPNFQKAWALSNLRLITAEHNIAKGDKIEIVNDDGTLSFISYEQYLTL